MQSGNKGVDEDNAQITFFRVYGFEQMEEGGYVFFAVEGEGYEPGYPFFVLENIANEVRPYDNKLRVRVFLFDKLYARGSVDGVT